MQLLMRRPEIEGFISVAPPANLYDFSFLAPCPSSGLIIHGDKDAVVPHKDVTGLVDKLKTQKGIIIEQKVVPGANHFFDGKVEPLMQSVSAYLDKRLKRRPARPSAACQLTARASTPPVIGCGTPVVRREGERQAAQRAHREKGEGLRLERVGRPADRSAVSTRRGREPLGAASASASDCARRRRRRSSAPARAADASHARATPPR